MKSRFSLIPYFLLLLTFLTACVGPFAGPTPTPTSSPTATATRTLSPTPSPRPTITPRPLPGDMAQTFIISMEDNGYSHLFAYAPGKLPLTRITNGQWDDISPSISADGTKVVFASNRNAYWDIYVLNLNDGQLSRITDTPNFDGDPSWSPDALWIVYESMVGDQTDINIISTTNGQIIQLTGDPAFDQTPVWSPQGRQVAFVSNRSGDDEIWIANLDKPDEGRFVNVSESPDSIESHPAWSPDGTRLAWASHTASQADSIFIWDINHPDQAGRLLGIGDWPAWSNSGNEIATRLMQPNQQYLIAYSLDGNLTMSPVPVNDIRGMDWHAERANAIPLQFFKPAMLTPTALWQMQIQLVADVPGQRASVVKLLDVEAPHPYLHDAVNESFSALRQRVIRDTGWDALASLENAYTPLTSTLDPGQSQDWLFTGRAFTLNPLTLNAGWMVAMREDIGGQTYWRIYLRTVAQDGSQGEPLRTRPWDLLARYNVDPQAYDQGGVYAKSIPDGFWVDFTALAHKFGWQRMPALGNWRTYFKGTQFNEFILTGGLDWRAAMLQLYPSDIFVTPTVVIPPTRTPTETPKGYHYKTPTATVTYTSTPRPTYTPSP